MFINTRTRTRTRTDGFVPGDKWSFFFLVYKNSKTFNCFFLFFFFFFFFRKTERQKDRRETTRVCQTMILQRTSRGGSRCSAINNVRALVSAGLIDSMSSSVSSVCSSSSCTTTHNTLSNRNTTKSSSSSSSSSSSLQIKSMWCIHLNRNQQKRSIKTSSSHATTVLGIRKDSKTVLIADGQVTMGSEIIKHNVIKVRKLGDGVISGFAGSTADAFTLFERLEQKIEEHPGQLTRACVELAKNWRTDKYLRKLEATMIVADKHHMFQITGNGDVLEPSNGIIGIGSGGSYALAASKALVDVEGLNAMDIAKKAMDIAANTCVYTNNKFQILTLDSDASTEEEKGKKDVDEGREG